MNIRMVRVRLHFCDLLGNVFREEDLTGVGDPSTDMSLHMDMDRSSRIPSGINREELCSSVLVGHLNAAQESRLVRCSSASATATPAARPSKSAARLSTTGSGETRIHAQRVTALTIVKSFIVRLAGRGLALVLLVATVGCDRVTKHLASTHLADKPAQSYLSDTLRLEYAENSGAFLSLGSQLPEPVRFAVFRIGIGIALLTLLVIALRRQWRGLALAGATLIFAGGMSNLIDRLIHGNVVDFASVGLGVLRTGIFNFADVAILLGGVLLVIGSSERVREL